MTKIISLSNEAYNRLKNLKNGKSFSEVVIEMIETNKGKKLKDFFGIWKEDKEFEKIKRILEKDRKKSRLREVRL